MKYESPVFIQSDELAEGIFMASGEDVPGSKTCNSVYMKGVFKKDDFSNWSSGTLMDVGCLNCPANWGRCAVNDPYLSKPGPYMPLWEKLGHAPTERWSGNQY